MWCIRSKREQSEVVVWPRGKIPGAGDMSLERGGPQMKAANQSPILSHLHSCLSLSQSFGLNCLPRASWLNSEPQEAERGGLRVQQGTGPQSDNHRSGI